MFLLDKRKWLHHHRHNQHDRQQHLVQAFPSFCFMIAVFVTLQVCFDCLYYSTSRIHSQRRSTFLSHLYLFRSQPMSVLKIMQIFWRQEVPQHPLPAHFPPPPPRHISIELVHVYICSSAVSGTTPEQALARCSSAFSILNKTQFCCSPLLPLRITCCDFFCVQIRRCVAHDKFGR